MLLNFKDAYNATDNVRLLNLHFYFNSQKNTYDVLYNTVYKVSFPGSSAD